MFREKETPGGVVAAQGFKDSELSETNQGGSENQTLTIPQASLARKARGAGSVSYKNKRPLLRGFMVGNLVFVHCPWCDKMHVHGWDRADNARVVTPRYAHCHSAGAPGSYWISIFRKRTLETIKQGRHEAALTQAIKKLKEGKGL
jgi:hypothetical protein